MANFTYAIGGKWDGYRMQVPSCGQIDIPSSDAFRFVVDRYRLNTDGKLEFHKRLTIEQSQKESIDG